MTQATLKDQPITITFSYWDGSGHRRNVTLKKGTILSKKYFKALIIKDIFILMYDCINQLFYLIIVKL